MPQKDYIGKKNKLPKVVKSKPADNLLKDEVESDNSVEQLSKDTTTEKFSLYVRGAAWIKDRDNAPNRLKEICSKIQDVRHPRQKGADYCFIDFASAADRDTSYEELKNNSEVNVKHVTKDQPNLLEKRKKKVSEKREARKEARRLLAKIKKNEKLNEKSMEKTNEIIITNLPVQTTATELKQHFTNAVKINMKLRKKAKKINSTIITFCSPYDAFTASKQEVILHEQKLNIVLNTNAAYKKEMKNKRKQPIKKVNGEPNQKSSKVVAN
ncbi:uncharacterized protein LOC129575522 [Sitodiplosis mosellana]|uniref:uncharacterized protein LOC129575522 n=1 Tax=Sitodiplosis mosellana TaxID=263140 RepID=UPI002445279B|nr:uncharacterized protein LOC129575522 [Sitodiplosis mosellana]